jgi:hypothetical protein
VKLAPPYDYKPRFIELFSKKKPLTIEVQSFILELAHHSRFENQKSSVDADFDLGLILLNHIKNQLDLEVFPSMVNKIEAARWLFKCREHDDLAQEVLYELCNSRWTPVKKTKHAPN